MLSNNCLGPSLGISIITIVEISDMVKIWHLDIWTNESIDDKFKEPDNAAMQLDFLPPTKGCRL